MAVTVGGNGRMYFLPAGSTAFTEQYSLRFALKNDYKPHVYELDLTALHLPGTISQFRLDPTDDRDGTFAVDYVRFK